MVLVMYIYECYAVLCFVASVVLSLVGVLGSLLAGTGICAEIIRIP